MIRIAICDDNQEYVAIVKEYLNNLNISRMDYDVYFSGEELIASYQISPTKYDVILLDMEMQGLNGIETANLIRQVDDQVIIIFITNYSEYMKESFQCEPFRFLIKPLVFSEIESAFQAIVKKLSKKRNTVVFEQNKTKVRLYCDDIIVCESQGHWTWIYTKENVYKVCRSLSEFYKLLDETAFVQPHKSFVINMQYIKYIKGKDIVLYHFSRAIPISRSQKKLTVTEYTNFTERSLFL